MRKAVLATLALAACVIVPAGCGDDDKGQGDVIRTFVDEVAPMGEMVYRWDQRTDDGRDVTPGWYGAWFRSGGFDSTAVFEIIADEEPAQMVGRDDPLPSLGYSVWTGSEAYVLGELVDVHVYLPVEGRAQVKIVKL
jgi:hypothetical protein